ncbi:hypothetical protein GCM10027170_34380 [Aliiglaciecola aliphaticivorans]
MSKLRFKKIAQASIIVPLSLSVVIACSNTDKSHMSRDKLSPQSPIPATKFDLSNWKITVPVDMDNNGKIDEIDMAEMQTYVHPDFFYLDENGGMVFATPNKAITTASSSNTRSELRQAFRGTNKKIKTKAPGNNFALAAHANASQFASIGSKIDATLKVDHVAIRAKNPNTPAAYSVVVGQIHAVKDDKVIAQNQGFGYGNEPIKIYFKKWPNHQMGSVFWNYERNLAKTDPNRTDIAYPVWGNTWKNPNEPGDKGIALGEEFSYRINVHQNTMYLTFSAKGKDDVKYAINLANNIDAYGKVDEKDNPQGYAGDSHYFKAGAYNQCSTKDQAGTLWYAGCLGTGNWQTDKMNGDYTQVTFSKLTLSSPQAQ